MELYHIAGNAGDANRVADLQLKWTTTNKPKAAPASFEQKVTPDRMRGVQPPSSPQTGDRVWTGQEIKDFYQAKMKGQYTQEEASRLERDIFAAQREGRIREHSSSRGRPF